MRDGGGGVIGMLQNFTIQLNVARQFNVSKSVIIRLWNRHQQICPVVGVNVPQSNASHLLVTYALSYRTRNETQLQQQFVHATGVHVTAQTVSNRLHVSPLHGAAIECQPSPGKEGMVSTLSEVDCRTMVQLYILMRVDICSRFS